MQFQLRDRILVGDEMILVQLASGRTDRIDPTKQQDLKLLDSPSYQRHIRRVSVIDNAGKRVDMPLNRNGIFFMWLELLECDGVVKGEIFGMRTSNILLRATLYYSDNRVVIDIDHGGGFNARV